MWDLPNPRLKAVVPTPMAAYLGGYSCFLALISWTTELELCYKAVHTHLFGHSRPQQHITSHTSLPIICCTWAMYTERPVSSLCRAQSVRTASRPMEKSRRYPSTVEQVDGRSAGPERESNMLCSVLWPNGCLWTREDLKLRTYPVSRSLYGYWR